VKYDPVGTPRVKGGNRVKKKRKHDEDTATSELAKVNGTVVEKKNKNTEVCQGNPIG
jgi:hypothetical protein